MSLRSGRGRALGLLLVLVFLLSALLIAGGLAQEAARETHFAAANLPPSLAHPFGTDRMGRDMLLRTLAGLSLSLRLGLLTSLVSCLLGAALSLTAAALGRWADTALTALVDMLLGVPHILLTLLISLAAGRGFWGVAAGVSLTHWPSLARLLRGELMQLRQSPFLLCAQQLGQSPMTLAWRYMAPHLLPQFITGLLLAFPHAILHEASITFLGFGLSAETPAIGVILSEGMSCLAAGLWWPAVLPGLSLVGLVLLFARLAEQIRQLLTPEYAHC